MERPRTGPMQFPGEIQPGVYLDWETVRMLFTADEAVALREIRQAFNGIQPVQRARLEEQVQAVSPTREIRVPRRVISGSPIGPRRVVEPGIYGGSDLQINQHGAVAVRTPGGYLGIKPDEFEWVIK